MRNRWSIWVKGLVLGAALAMLAAACGTDPTATPPPTNTPVPTATPTEEPSNGDPGTDDPTPTPTEMEEPTPTPTEGSDFDAAEYFEGKTIRLVANSNPGGGTDAQGRVMSAYMSEWIPGNPRIVFQNRPNKPQEYVFAAEEASKDGTYISWNSTPQLNFGFEEQTNFIKRSSFQFIGATIDSTRAWMTYDPVGNLGESAANSCVWDYAGMESTGGGQHGEFLLANEISDVSEGVPNVIAELYVLDALDAPFDYFAFDTVDTNAVRTMWARGDINSTVRSSLWYRFPLENPDWIPNGLMRVMANMGPGELGANAQAEPHCPDWIGDHLGKGPNVDDAQEVADTYDKIQAPVNYMSKALWLPPGTPDHIADALSNAFQTAFEQDEELLERYAAVAGERPRFTDRETGTELTERYEGLYEESLQVIEREGERLLEKYFPEYL